MKVKFPWFTQSGKMLTAVDCNKSHMYTTIPRAIAKKMIQRDTKKHCKKLK